MGSLQNIVNVAVTRQTSVPTRAGFGTGAFVSDEATFSTAVAEYSSYAAMVTATADLGTETLAAGAAYFGQQVSPTKLSVIKQKQVATPQVHDITVSTDLIASNSTLITVDGTGLTPVVYATSHVSTLAAVATEIQGSASVTTAVSDGTDTITITYADNYEHTITAVTTLGTTQPEWAIVLTTASGSQTLVQALNAAVNYNNDWYGFGIHSRVSADITLVSAWAQAQGNANPKLFFAQSDDTDILDSGISSDIASTTQALANYRTSIWYHALDAEYLEMALMGGQLPSDAGSITWAYKTLSSVTVDDLTDSEKNAASDKAANTYDTVASVAITEEGKTSDSTYEWIDVIRGVDWIQVNLAAELYTLYLNSAKVPYSTAGILQHKGIVSQVLSQAQSMGILSLDTTPVISVPDRADISAGDLASRTLNDITFTAVLAGAVQKVNVSGTVTL